MLTVVAVGAMVVTGRMGVAMRHAQTVSSFNGA
jgi:hypothetical protein